MKRSFLLPLALIAPLTLAACDDGAERITVLEQELEAERAGVTTTRTELETANARIVELEAADTERSARMKELEAAGAAGTPTMAGLKEPMNAVIVKLRDHQTGLQDLSGMIGDNEAASAKADELLAGMRGIGQDFQAAITAAGVELD